MHTHRFPPKRSSSCENRKESSFIVRHALLLQFVSGKFRVGIVKIAFLSIPPFLRDREQQISLSPNKGKGKGF